MVLILFDNSNWDVLMNFVLIKKKSVTSHTDDLMYEWGNKNFARQAPTLGHIFRSGGNVLYH